MDLDLRSTLSGAHNRVQSLVAVQHSLLGSSVFLMPWREREYQCFKRCLCIAATVVTDSTVLLDVVLCGRLHRVHKGLWALLCIFTNFV